MTGTGGTVITFYSYKGGTGRTMALANVAWILASNGRRVLAVDWDLESPGLHKYFHPFLADKHLRDSRGVIDMVREYSASMLHPPTESDDDDWLGLQADVLRYAVSLDWHFPDKGYLDFLPAGRQDAGYTKAVGTFDWSAFFERLSGNAFLEALGDNMRGHYDYVLIDSRTGVSDSAGICTVRLPDTVVDCFSLNAQSIDGALAVARSIDRQRGDNPVRLLPVPMRVEDAEQLKLEAGRDYARQSFRPFLGRQAEEEVNFYWGDIEIPYKPFYAYEEILAAFGDRSRQENSLLAAYERLTRAVTDGLVHQLPALDERIRRRWLAAFERRTVGSTVDVFLSYAAIDRIWAEWISDELTDAGLHVTMREIDYPASAEPGGVGGLLANAGRIVVLLSQGYIESPNATGLWKAVADRDPVAGAAFLVPIRLDNVRVPPPFVDRSPVDLAGLNQSQATEQLLNAVGQPGYPSTGEPVDGEGRQTRKRFPASEPPIWEVPQRNTAFTGRHQFLENLRTRLSTTASPLPPQALHGLGGVGKTQLALEYAHRFKAAYDLVWWVSAQQPSLVRSSLSALAERLGVPPGDSVTDRIKAGLEILRQGHRFERWLIIFDNADEPAKLHEHLPQGRGHVLITTRDRTWGTEAQLLEVLPFTREESVTFLLRRIPALSSADADQVASHLGDLPLAVDQAGAWLAATGMPVARYIELLEKQPVQMLEKDLPQQYQRTAAQPWLVSLDGLRQRSPAAAKLLEVCAFFAAEPIPVSLLYSARFISILLPHDPTLDEPMLMGRATREISRYALARFEASRPGSESGRRHRPQEIGVDRGQSLQLHRLVQTVIRATLPPEEADENRRNVHDILAAANPKDADQPENWPIYAELWPHVRPSGALRSQVNEVRQLVNDLARYLWKIYDYDTCQELADQAVQRWTETFGPDDRQVLMMRYNLACVRRLQADYTGAYEIDSDVYQRLTATLGGEHPYALMAGSSLAADMRGQGRFAEAKVLDENVEARWREWFGEENAQTLTAAHNLAISLRLVGDLKGALRLQERTLRLRRAVHGDRHPYALYSAASYGRDLRDTGELRSSRRELEAALELHRQILGVDHPETLRTSKSFAVTLRKLGEFEKARALSEDTLARTDALHGPQHPDTLACAMNLASNESALGEDAKALRRALPVYDWYRDNMGPDHSFTLAYGNNVGVFTQRSGELAGAHELIRRVLDRFTATMGDTHPYTLAAGINYGNVLFELGDFDAALSNDQAVFTHMTEVLGPEHPDTLAAAGNLAASLRACGDRAGAQSLLDATLATYRRVLGDEHPSTVLVRSRARLSCDLEPPPT
jgi:tetratricopeptide (TPR) repeat protein